jgi:uncharacterized protein
MKGMSLKQRARETWQKLLHLNATPHQIAAGFSIGVFISFLPIFGLRTVVAVGLAGLFRQNVIAAFAGKNITLLYNPAVPFLWLAEYRLGKQFVTVAHAEKFDRAHLHEILHMGWRGIFHTGWDAFAATMVGGLIIAIPVSVITYIVVKRLAARRQQRAGNVAP